MTRKFVKRSIFFPFVGNGNRWTVFVYWHVELCNFKYLFFLYVLLCYFVLNRYRLLSFFISSDRLNYFSRSDKSTGWRIQRQRWHGKSPPRKVITTCLQSNNWNHRIQSELFNRTLWLITRQSFKHNARKLIHDAETNSPCTCASAIFNKLKQFHPFENAWFLYRRQESLLVASIHWQYDVFRS